MEDIRLPEEKFEYRGREYILRCNMNVIADVQDMCGGMISPAIEDHASLKGCLCWLAAMMNDYADEQGWEDYTPYTNKTLGREISIQEIPKEKVMLVVRKALFRQVKTDGKEPDSEGNSKN